MTTNRPLRVFLCHSSADKPAVRELYQKLRTEPWIQPWLDEEDIFPGDDWNFEIQHAIRETDAIIVCLSKSSITKEGYVQKEIKTALDYSDEKPERTVYIIPVRLEECIPPERLSKWQYADYFMGQRDRAYEKLLVSLKKRALSLVSKEALLEASGNSKPEETSFRFYKNSIHLEYKINGDAKVISNYLLQHYLGNSVFVEVFNSVLQVEKIELFNPAEHDVFQYGFVAKGYKTTTTQGNSPTDKPEIEPIPEIFVITISQGQKEVSILSFDTDVKHAHMFTTGLVRELGKAFSVNLLNPSQYTSTRKGENLDIEKKPIVETQSLIEASSGKIEQLTNTLNALVSKPTEILNKIILSNGMEFMRVPAGSFLMGSKKDNKLSFDREFPQHVVDINYDYWMARFLVTKEQYSQFKKNDFEKDENNHPVVQVSWNEAVAYCDWLNNQVKKDLPMGLIIRLPTESEWEKSSRGTNALEYPWGYNFDENKCNTYEGEKGNTTPVGWYSPQDHSPYGCTDMSGNAWEWTHSLFMPYPYQFDDGRENGKVLGARVLRGGSFSDVKKRARCAYRIGYPIDYSDFSVSFRMVLAPPINHL